jgi:hypothetical protein
MKPDPRSAEWQKSALVAVIVQEQEADLVREDSLAYLIECVLAAAEEPRSAHDLRKEIEDSFRLAYPQLRVNKALELLSHREAIKEIRDDQSVRYLLAPNRAAHVAAQRKATEEFIRRVMDEWLAGVRRKNAQLTDEESALLVSDAQEYLGAVVRHYGSVRAVLLGAAPAQVPLVYPDPQKLLDRSWGGRSPELREVAREALTEFFESPTELRGNYLDAVFENCAELTFQYVEERGGSPFGLQPSQQLILLDTNVVLGLLGYDARRQQLALAVVQASRSMGIPIAVTSRTKQEFLGLLGVADDLYRALGGPPRPRPADAGVVAGPGIDNPFIQAFLEAVAKGSQDSWSQFCARARQVAEALTPHGVKAVSLNAPQVAEPRKTQLADLVRKFASAKTWQTCDHDRFHYLAVRHRRAATSPWGCWFITFDTSLPLFDYEARLAEEESGFAFCMSPECWTAWLQKTTPAYARGSAGTAVGTLAFSLPFHRAESNAGAIVRLLAVTQGWDGSPDLIKRVATDAWLHEEARKAFGEGDKDRVGAIDNALASALRRAEERLQRERAADAARLGEELQRLREHIARLETEREREKEASVAREREREADRQRLAEQSAAAQDAARRAEAAEQARRREEARARTAESRQRAWTYGLASVTLSSLLAAFAVATQWPMWLFSVCTVPVALVAVRFLWHRALVLGLLTGVIVFVFPLIAILWLAFWSHLPPQQEQLWLNRISASFAVIQAAAAVAALVLARDWLAALLGPRGQ